MNATKALADSEPATTATPRGNIRSTAPSPISVAAPFVIESRVDGAALLAHAAENATDRSLAALAPFSGRPLTLLVTSRRADALRLPAADANAMVCVTLPDVIAANAIRRLIDPSPAEPSADAPAPLRRR